MAVNSKSLLASHMILRRTPKHGPGIGQACLISMCYSVMLRSVGNMGMHALRPAKFILHSLEHSPHYAISQVPS